MRIATSLLFVMLAVGLAHAADQKTREEAVPQVIPASPMDSVDQFLADLAHSIDIKKPDEVVPQRAADKKARQGAVTLRAADNKKREEAVSQRAAVKKARQGAVTQLAADKAYQKRIAEEWAEFSERFVIRRIEPIYSGPYQVGARMVVTPNYEAIDEYKRQLDIMAWNAMTDQQKRDLALFTIAANTGVIAANTGVVAANTGVIAANTEAIADQLRSDALNRLIEERWPRPR